MGFFYFLVALWRTYFCWAAAHRRYTRKLEKNLQFHGWAVPVLFDGLSWISPLLWSWHRVVTCLTSSRSDDHNPVHGHVLSRVVSRLIRISVFPCFLGVLTSSLNNKRLQRERGGESSGGYQVKIENLVINYLKSVTFQRDEFQIWKDFSNLCQICEIIFSNLKLILSTNKVLLTNIFYREEMKTRTRRMFDILIKSMYSCRLCTRVLQYLSSSHLPFLPLSLSPSLPPSLPPWPPPPFFSLAPRGLSVEGLVGGCLRMRKNSTLLFRVTSV